MILGRAKKTWLAVASSGVAFWTVSLRDHRQSPLQMSGVLAQYLAIQRFLRARFGAQIAYKLQ